MKAFHGNQELKDRYIKLLEQHYDDEQIVRNIYANHRKEGFDVYKDDYGNMSRAACVLHPSRFYTHHGAIACFLHTDKGHDIILTLPGISGAMKTEILAQYLEKDFGIPAVLSVIIDGIFIDLPPKAAKEFALNCFKSIKVGSDLSRVHARFVRWILGTSKNFIADLPQDSLFTDDPEARSICMRLLALNFKQLEGKEIAREEIEKVYSLIKSLHRRNEDAESEKCEYHGSLLHAALAALNISLTPCYNIPSLTDGGLVRAGRLAYFSYKNLIAEGTPNIPSHEAVSRAYAHQLIKEIRILCL